MRNIRTDLAVEAVGTCSYDSDVSKKTENIMGYEATFLDIGENAAKEMCKPAGLYISAEFGRLWNSSREELEKVARMICALIERVAPEGDGCVLAAGLGNDRVTPDSVGPKAMKKTVVTRHIKNLDPELYTKLGFGECAAVITGVLGETGVESADILKGVAEHIKPRCIIVVDALSARSMDRLATTVQISSSGIAPGSGVNNRRSEISSKTMGYPVISLGFPTVVDAATLTLDMLEEANVGESLLDAAENKLRENGKTALFVSPKDCDIITDCLGDLAAASINYFVHGEADIPL